MIALADMADDHLPLRPGLLSALLQALGESLLTGGRSLVLGLLRTIRESLIQHLVNLGPGHDDLRRIMLLHFGLDILERPRREFRHNFARRRRF